MLKSKNLIPTMLICWELNSTSINIRFKYNLYSFILKSLFFINAGEIHRVNENYSEDLVYVSQFN